MYNRDKYINIYQSLELSIYFQLEGMHEGCKEMYISRTVIYRCMPESKLKTVHQDKTNDITLYNKVFT